MEIRAFLADGTATEAAATALGDIQGFPEVASAVLVTPKEALERARARHASRRASADLRVAYVRRIEASVSHALVVVGRGKRFGEVAARIVDGGRIGQIEEVLQGVQDRKSTRLNSSHRT